MNSKRFKERFKHKASYVTRNGKLTITPENFIPKFPMFKTQCHSYDDYLHTSNSSSKSNLTPTPISQNNLQHFNHSPDIFYEENLNKIQIIKISGYKPSSHFVIKKTHSFLDKRENDQEYYSKEFQKINRKKLSYRSEVKGHNTSYSSKRLSGTSQGMLEKKKTYSGRTFARQVSGIRMTPKEMYIKNCLKSNFEVTIVK